MDSSKTYYGGTYLSKEDLKESSINHKVELEYYKTKKYENNKIRDNIVSYGIQILKKEYKNENVNIEAKTIDYVSSNSKKIVEIINTLKKHKVTPIGLNDVLDDLLRIEITE